MHNKLGVLGMKIVENNCYYINKVLYYYLLLVVCHRDFTPKSQPLMLKAKQRGTGSSFSQSFVVFFVVFFGDQGSWNPDLPFSGRTL